jgi:chaperonin cofactor prefoldin
MKATAFARPPTAAQALASRLQRLEEELQAERQRRARLEAQLSAAAGKGDEKAAAP